MQIRAGTVELPAEIPPAKALLITETAWTIDNKVDRDHPTSSKDQLCLKFEVIK
jgi:hypothetical protein